MDFGDTDLSNKRLKGFAKGLYVGMLVVTLVIAVASFLMNETRDLVLILPIIVILAMTMFTDRRSVHIPPVLIMMMCITFYISVIGRLLTDGTAVMLVVNFLVGVNFGLLGLIMVYMLLRSMPGVRNENPVMVIFFMMSIAIATYIVMRMIQYYAASFWTEIEGIDLAMLMDEMLMVILGAAVVCILYYEDDRHNLFKYTLGSFLEENSEALGLENRQREDILRLIRDGESERLEFKSTLRTNLETGETDKRMEKAVLKTIVAFLNTDGGNLLIGVDDDGEVIGADLHSFENKDKMGLHLTNLISSKIGNSFLPYISFNLVDFDDKVIIRVKCDPCPLPVFYKDGKTEIFFVRSGPRTEELTGTTLLGYVKNREGDKKMRKMRKKFKDPQPVVAQKCDESEES